MIKILLQTLQPPKIKTVRILKTIFPEQKEMVLLKGKSNGESTIIPFFFMRKQLSPTRKPITNA